jgi:hypothetical protein
VKGRRMRRPYGNAGGCNQPRADPIAVRSHLSSVICQCLTASPVS